MTARLSARGFALALLLAGMAGPLSAQEPWKDSYYPYFLKGPNDKVSLVLHYHFGQAAEYMDRVPFNGSLAAEAGANADGSRFLVARFKAPKLVRGWRFFAEAGSVRENRFGYYGLGNDAEELPADGGSYANRVGRTRIFGRAEVTRRIAGPLQLAIGGDLTDASFRALPGGSRFEDDYFAIPPCQPAASCPAPPGDPSATDASLRVSLVLDTRDSEFLTTRGVFVEGGWLGGTGGEGYRGWYGIARGYVNPWFGGVVAARIAARTIDQGAPLDSRFGLSSWERNVPVLGGPESHRSFVYGRYAGRDLLLANLELRQTILDFADFGAIGATAFLDAGRVTEGLPGESKDLHVGGGGGLFLRILRSTMLSFNFAGGADGFKFSMGTGYGF
jgi:hypothetical protein